MNLERLDLEKWEVLESERSSTYADPMFQHWAKELNVSQSYSDREGIVRANELNNQYNYSVSNRSNPIRSILSIFN